MITRRKGKRWMGERFPVDDSYSGTGPENSSESSDSSPDSSGNRQSKSRGESSPREVKMPLGGDLPIDKCNEEPLYAERHERQNMEAADDREGEGVVSEKTDEERNSMKNDKQHASGSQKRKRREMSGGPRKVGRLVHHSMNRNYLCDVQNSIEDKEGHSTNKDQEQETDGDTGANNNTPDANRSLDRPGERTSKSRSNSTSTLSLEVTFFC